MKRTSLLVLTILVIALITACGTPVPASTLVSVIPTVSSSVVLPQTSTQQPAIVPSATVGNTEVSFAKDVMPIFSNSCTKCHGVDQVKAGLDMTTYDKLMAGSFKGPALVAGNASESKLIELVKQGKMPKRGDKLTPEQIQIIINWINAGALNN